MKIIGLCGYGGTGKDEVGRILVENHGYKRFAKGDLIKEAAWLIDPLIRDQRTFIDGARSMQTLSWDHGGFHYQTPVEKVDQLKDHYPEIRSFLQHLADDVVTTLGRDVWNDALYEKIEEHFETSANSPVVLTRLSLPFEVDRLWDAGGKLIRIERNGLGPANQHPNEVALDDVLPDGILHNNGTLKDLEGTVQNMEEMLW